MFMSASDEELIAAIVRGDRDAFSELYRRRREDVYRFALHMTGSPASAEDVVHDAFLAVIEAARRYDPRRAGVVPWLLGIARNHARRRHATDRATHPLPAGVTRIAADSVDPIDGLSRERQVRAVREALEALPVVYREVIVLCDLQELSYADAAAALRCALGTVRSRLHRGRALLAAHLRGEMPHAARWPSRDWVL
jgi:RNA polymerase sigma-70 factor (ECF subfamily)